MSQILIKLISPLIQKRTFKSAWAQGIARYSKEEVYDFAREDIKALSILLGDKKFFVGEKVSTYELAAFAVLANCAFAPVNPKIKAIIEDYPNLIKFAERINREFYPEKY